MGERTLPLVPELSVEETIRREYNQGPYEIVLDMAHTGQEHSTPSGHGTEKTMFLLFETIKDDKDFPYSVGDRFVYIIYYSVRGDQIVYRAYSERTCPAAHNCPMKFLQQLTPTQDEQVLAWRAACWTFWQWYASQVAPRWKETSGKMQDLFLAMYLSKAKTVVCFHEGLFYWLEWTGEIAPFTKLQEGLYLRCSRVWRIGISAVAADLSLRKGSLQDAVSWLTVGSGRHLSSNVPITHGWIALDIVQEG